MTILIGATEAFVNIVPSKEYLGVFAANQDENLIRSVSNRSENTPAASWLPILLSHIGYQVKWRQSQSYKFKEFVKISNFKTKITRDTPSEVAW